MTHEHFQFARGMATAQRTRSSRPEWYACVRFKRQRTRLTVNVAPYNYADGARVRPAVLVSSGSFALEDCSWIDCKAPGGEDRAAIKKPDSAVCLLHPAEVATPADEITSAPVSSHAP